MAKASPARRNFNAGEFSILVEGRTDIDKQAASMRQMRNCIAAPQGPCLGRSGTYFLSEVHDNDKYSTLIPFVYSDTEALNLEFSNNRLRFVFETGLQTYTPEAITAITATSPNLIVTSAALVASGVVTNSRIALNGFNNAYNLNTRVFKVLSVAGNNITLDVSLLGVIGAVTATGARVYSIATPYSDVDARNIRAVQDQDVIYLFCRGYQPRKLARNSAYDWVLSLKDFNNGPFMSEGVNGRITLNTNGNTLIAANGTATGGTNPGNALIDDLTTYWDSGAAQTGTWTFQYTVGRVINGYVIYPAYVNNDTAYAAVDYAPGTWTFEGSNNGSAWTILDTQKEFILYEDRRSPWFKFNNTTSYTYYRFVITQTTRNGNINPRVARFIFSEMTAPSATVTLSGTYTDVNGGVGFKTTDVGRLLRVKGNDNWYRTLRITGYTSATVVTTTIVSEPFLDASVISTNWSPGYFSDTTGWPSCGCFFEDRLWVAGVSGFPGLVAGSRTGNYDDYQQKTATDEVLDDSAIAATVKSRKVSDVRWLETDERGLLLGTGTGEFVISAANPDNALTARNVKGRASTARGSAFVEPVKVDRQILHVHVSRRSVREYTYSFQSDGYVSRSMSLFASHLGIPRFAQMVYAAEPHSIIWFRRDDGSVVGFTYNKEEDVLGWHQHDFSGVVESLSVIPSAVDIQDTLWMVIRREVNGQQRRYIERLTRFWDFDSVVEQAHYVDSGLKYEGAATNVLYGLSHLEGKSLNGVLNGIPYEDMIVTNGTLALPIEDVTTAVVGLPYVQLGEIANIEAGAADGTAQGKVKRIHNVSAHVWDMAYGEVGVWDSEQQEYTYEDIEYREKFDMLESIKLQTEVLKPVNMPPGYNNRGSIIFRQTKPLPLNIIALYPQMNTQDR